MRASDREAVRTDRRLDREQRARVAAGAAEARRPDAAGVVGDAPDRGRRTEERRAGRSVDLMIRPAYSAVVDSLPPRQGPARLRRRRRGLWIPSRQWLRSVRCARSRRPGASASSAASGCRRTTRVRTASSTRPAPPGARRPGSVADHPAQGAGTGTIRAAAGTGLPRRRGHGIAAVPGGPSTIALMTAPLASSTVIVFSQDPAVREQVRAAVGRRPAAGPRPGRVGRVRDR